MAFGSFLLVRLVDILNIREHIPHSINQLDKQKKDRPATQPQRIHFSYFPPSFSFPSNMPPTVRKAAALSPYGAYGSGSGSGAAPSDYHHAASGYQHYQNQHHQSYPQQQHHQYHHTGGLGPNPPPPSVPADLLASMMGAGGSSSAAAHYAAPHRLHYVEAIDTTEGSSASFAAAEAFPFPTPAPQPAYAYSDPYGMGVSMGVGADALPLPHMNAHSGAASPAVALPNAPPAQLVRSFAKYQRDEAAKDRQLSPSRGGGGRVSTTSRPTSPVAFSGGVGRPTKASLLRKAATATPNSRAHSSAGNSRAAPRNPTTAAAVAVADRRMAADGGNGNVAAVGAADGEEGGTAPLSILLRYKAYVDERLAPQLQRALDEADGLRAELADKTAALNEALGELGAASGTAGRLRTVLDGERLRSDAAHAEQLAALKAAHAAAMAALRSEADAANAEVAKSKGNQSRLTQLERLLELRDAEIGRLKASAREREREQRSREEAEEAAARRANQQYAGLNSDGSSLLPMGGGGVLSASASDAAAAVDALVSDSLSYLTALSAACQRAGLGGGGQSSSSFSFAEDPFGPSASAWRSGDLSAVSSMLQAGVPPPSSSSTTVSPSAAAALVAGRLAAAVGHCLKAERSCVSAALGALAATHAATLASVGDRDLELAKVRDVHAQRIAELERDAAEQLRLLRGQLAHQGQYLHHPQMGAGGGSSPLGLGRGGGGASASSPLASSPVGGGASTSSALVAVASGGGAVFGGDFDGWSGGGGTGAAAGGNKRGQNNNGGNRMVAATSSSLGGLPLRSIGTQTVLDVNVLFPGVAFGALGAASSSTHNNNGGGGGRRGSISSGGGAFSLVGGDSSSAGGFLGPSASSADGGNNGALLPHQQPAELLTSDAIDGAAVARLVAELRVLEAAVARLTAENASLWEERRRHLYYMQMRNVSAREQDVMAEGSVVDLLLQ